MLTKTFLLWFAGSLAFSLTATHENGQNFREQFASQIWSFMLKKFDCIDAALLLAENISTVTALTEFEPKLNLVAL
jgi:hypothetical protein